MNKHKVKYIFECSAAKELTTFNADYNQSLIDYCERKDTFRPDLECLNHTEGSPCKYLRIHHYKGDK